MNVLQNRKQHLSQQCISYSTFAYMHLKKYKYDFIKKFQVKRFIINENDKDYDPHHYYMELVICFNNQDKRVIIDNEGHMNYFDYKNRYQLKGASKVSYKELKDNYLVMDKELELMVEMDFEYNVNEIMELLKEGKYWLV